MTPRYFVEYQNVPTVETINVSEIIAQFCKIFLWYHFYLTFNWNDLNQNQWREMDQDDPNRTHALPPPHKRCKNEHVNGSRVKAEDLCLNLSVWVRVCTWAS